MRTFAYLAAFFAAMLAGLSLSYARFIHREGNGQRRFMRWIGPLWALLAAWYCGIWIWDATSVYPVNTVAWLRPAAWLVWAIPAAVLLRAIIEDTRHREEARRAERALESKVQQVKDMLNDGD